MAIDVEVKLSEVLLRLRDTGAFRQALREVAEAKAGGKEIGNIKVTGKGSAGGELGEDELNAVVGGAGGGLQNVDTSVTYAAIKRMGFADTTW